MPSQVLFFQYCPSRLTSCCPQVVSALVTHIQASIAGVSSEAVPGALVLTRRQFHLAAWLWRYHAHIKARLQVIPIVTDTNAIS